MQSKPGVWGRNDIDNHADTCALSSNWTVIEDTGQVAEVSGFSDELSTVKNIPIVKAISIFIDPETGEEILLMIDQALYFGDRLEHSLINPNQIRAFGHSLNDDAYYTDRYFGIETAEVKIPFESVGSVVYFRTCTPTDGERERLPALDLTAPTWDPQSLEMPGSRKRSVSAISSQETDGEASSIEISAIQRRQRSVIDEGNLEDDSLTRSLCSISTTFDDKLFLESLTKSVRVDGETLKDAEEVDRLGIDFDDFGDFRLMAIKQVRSQLRRERELEAVYSRTRHSKVNAEHLSKIWDIPLSTAQKTMRVTTASGVRNVTTFPYRRYRDLGSNLYRKHVKGHWFADSLKAKVKSIDQKQNAVVYTNGRYTTCFPIEKETDEEFAKSYDQFVEEIGDPPEHLTTDMAPAFVGRLTKFRKNLTADRVKFTNSESGRKNQNYAAEAEIGMLRRKWRRMKQQRGIPDRLWSFGMKHIASISQFLPRGRNGRSSWEEVHGRTPPIAEHADFGLYDLVWYYDHAGDKNNPQRLGRWLGVSPNVGSDLTFFIISATGDITSNSSVQHVTVDDWLNPDIQARIRRFDERLAERLDPANHGIPENELAGASQIDDDMAVPRDETAYGGPETTPTEGDYGGPDGSMSQNRLPDVDEFPDDERGYDQYLNAELMFQIGDNFKRGRVVKRARGLNGETFGTASSNPILDSRKYVVQFSDGTEENFLASQIAECMFSQVDSEGNQFLLIDSIVDHKKGDDAVPIEDGYVERHGRRYPKRTTRGWKLLVEFKDGEMEWIPLNEMKESYPVQVAEYAIDNQIHKEPAFNWWVHKVIKKRNRILSKVKSRYWRTTHKFGIRVPKSFDEAMALDKANGNDYWNKALVKEMAKAKVAWRVEQDVTPEEVRKGKVPGLIGFQEIRCHLVFDVKMDLTRKARFCANGNETETPATAVYSSVVSRDSVRLAFLIAALNDLDVLAADVTNAYLNAPVKEKIWFVGGPECGEGHGKVCVLVRALYGLKSSGNAWRTFFAQTLEKMGFKSTQADRDVWIKESCDDGFAYYEMIFVYVDDILVLSRQAQGLIDEIQKLYELKGGGAEEPTTYLGATIEKFINKDGKELWAMSPEKYLKAAVEVVKQMLEEDEDHVRFKGTSGTVKSPFPSGYKPELDLTPELDSRGASRFAQLIGILRWAIEIGAIDMYTEVSMMSQYQALPREGHLEALYHIFCWIKNGFENKKKFVRKKRIVFDPKTIDLDLNHIRLNEDWSEFYPDAREEIPRNRPRPLGNPVRINCFVDANHAGNVATRRSHTGVLIMVQNAPIIWYSKRQNTVESSSFGSEFIALRIAKELVVGLRYKLMMFGIPIVGPDGTPDGPAVVHCDNNGVVKNTSLPTSTLQKRHVSISYHSVREAVAAGVIVVSKEDGTSNLADGFTKVLVPVQRDKIFGKLLV